ncbi:MULTISPECIES: transcriptional regulator [Streptomyces]|uniref:Transcriptional regulator n=1 Tax=Streptomyces luteosporeus TaxID=173856 RepID=A0ABN3TJM1_9ACTN
MSTDKKLPELQGTSYAELRRTQLAARLPGSLSELAGPAHGVVEPPLHVVWSGLRRFDLDHRGERLGLYQILLNEGRAEDLIGFLNPDLLVADWPLLRRLLGKHVRHVWECTFVELGAGTDSAAA